MKGSIFKRGFKEARKEGERREKLRELKKGRLFRFFIGKKDPDDIPLRFLTEEPINYYEHNLKQGNSFVNIPCSGDGCPHCEEGDRPSYVSAWLVVDGRTFEAKERDSSGKETGKTKKVKDRIKLLVRGLNTTGIIDRLATKHGLLDKIWYVTKMGQGNGTFWNFERGEDDPLSPKQLKALFAQLPEELQDLDPYEILEQQLQMELEISQGIDNASASVDNEEDDSEDDSRIRSKVKSKVQNIGDDEEDEEEEPAPKKSSKLGSKSKRKRDEDSDDEEDEAPKKSLSKSKSKLGKRK